MNGLIGPVGVGFVRLGESHCSSGDQVFKRIGEPADGKRGWLPRMDSNHESPLPVMASYLPTKWRFTTKRVLPWTTSVWGRCLVSYSNRRRAAVHRYS